MHSIKMIAKGGYKVRHTAVAMGTGPLTHLYARQAPAVCADDRLWWPFVQTPGAIYDTGGQRRSSQGRAATQALNICIYIKEQEQI